MITMNYALIDAKGIVENVITLDDPADYTPPDGCSLVGIDDGVTAGIGYTYCDGVFTAPPLPVPTIDEQRAARIAAYTREADPIYFKSQRGEATIEEWEAKIEEIKTRFPYPGDNAS